MSLNTALLLLGSNTGDTKKNIGVAMRQIELRIGSIKKTSTMLKTKPVEFVSNNYFCNIAMSINTHFSPVRLLSELKSIEREMGRELDSRQLGGYRDRIVDIDIVEFNSIDFESDKLKIPHIKHLLERDFSKQMIKEIKEH